MSARFVTGVLLVVYLVLLNVPYVHLMNIFEYDDVLREPAAVVLTRFAEGGTELVLTWFAFGVGALAFIPLAFAIRRSLASGDGHLLQSTVVFGSLSAFAQGVGLLRWVFVITPLATMFVDPTTSPSKREAILVVYDSVHHFGGLLLGEFLGQVLLACWTLGIALALWKRAGFAKLLSVTGAGIALLWIVAQLENLSAILPGLHVPEMVPIAFIGWQVWLLALGVYFIVTGSDD